MWLCEKFKRTRLQRGSDGREAGSELTPVLPPRRVGQCQPGFILGMLIPNSNEKTPGTFFCHAVMKKRLGTELFGLPARVCGRAGKNWEEKNNRSRAFGHEARIGSH